jgi:cell filamentation protein
MSNYQNNYNYVDYERLYTYADSDVLRNKFDISNSDKLAETEHEIATIKMVQLFQNPTTIKSSAELCVIHRIIFEDIYEWAGEFRKVEIAKGSTRFLATERFSFGLQYVDNLVSEYLSIGRDDVAALSSKLAEILDNVNALHPFREGNGRSQREFIRCLALQKGFNIDLNPPPPYKSDIYQMYWKGTVDGDLELLAKLFEKLMSVVGE